MAHNKTRQGLGKPTRDTLSAIDRMLAEMEQKPIQPDEWTINMLIERDPSIPYSTLSNKLRTKLIRGEITKRIICVNGKSTNVYRYAG